LKSFVVEIDETTYENVVLDTDEMKQGQKFKLPQQNNPEVKKFEGKTFYLSEIERGPGGKDTIVYKIRGHP